MGIIFFLLPISVLLGVFALIGYFWGVKNGQFDDLDTPPLKVLFNDDEEKINKNSD